MGGRGPDPAKLAGILIGPSCDRRMHATGWARASQIFTLEHSSLGTWQILAGRNVYEHNSLGTWQILAGRNVYEHSSHNV
jgi:hypothetical protein